MSDDMRFSPDRIEVKQGETIRFVIRNLGEVMHEMVIGTRQELESHAELMKKHPNMVHDEPYMAHVGPRSTGEIIWNFDQAGNFEFACLIAGHFSAGMQGQIIVASNSSAPQGRSTAPVASQTHQHGHAASAASSGGAAANIPSDEWIDGEVRRIQRDPPKITIRHGEIKSLDMPAMTMVFGVRDPSMLDQFKQGDRVRFRTARESDTFVVTEIETRR